MEFMGFRNTASALQKAEDGYLLKLREDDRYGMDSFAMNVLLYMAAKTYDWPKDDTSNPSIPSRYYDQGWRTIAKGLGLLFIGAPADATDELKRSLSKKRQATAKNRISRAWTFLADAMLLTRIKPASLGDNAGYVLLLGDDEENTEVVDDAKSLLGLDDNIIFDRRQYA